MAHEKDDPLKFWEEQCWSQGVTPWHLSQPHGFLTSNYNNLLHGQPASELRILVPLCGKSVDLIWLKNQGFGEVIGVEGVRRAIETFSSESEIPLLEGTYKNTDIKSFSSEDGRLCILMMDFFTLDHPTLNGSFDCVWDRASIVAILPEHRPLYAATMQRLLKKSFRYLMNTVEYDQNLMMGPPFSVPKSSIDSVFASFCRIVSLERSGDNTSGHQVSIKDQPMADMTRCLYLLTPK